MIAHGIEHGHARVDVGIEGAPRAVSEDGGGDLPARHVALVAATAALMAREGLDFAQCLGHGGFVSGDQLVVTADAGLDRDRLRRVEGGVETRAPGRHTLRELLARWLVVIARHALEPRVGDGRAFGQADRFAQLAEAPTVDLHSLRTVIRLTEIFSECPAEVFAHPNRQHATRKPQRPCNTPQWVASPKRIDPAVRRFTSTPAKNTIRGIPIRRPAIERLSLCRRRRKTRHDCKSLKCVNASANIKTEDEQRTPTSSYSL